MGDVSNIKIDEVILHILDPPDRILRAGASKPPVPRGLILSGRPLPATTDQLIWDYFKNHIEKSLRNDNVRAANFSNLGAESAKICKDLLAGMTDLVQSSQQIAQQLYKIMLANRSISRGDLAACLYSGDKNGRRGRYLALLKIDPTDALLQITQNDDQGHSYITIVIETEAMPTGNLQKCAFISELAPRPVDYDMILLDLQLPTEEVARFFSKDLLGAEVVMDSRHATKRLIEGLADVENRLLPTLESQSWEQLHKDVQNVLSQPSVNLKKWISDLNLPQEAKEQISASLPFEQLPEIIQVDRAYAEKLTKKVRYKGDYQLTVEILASKLDKVIRITHVKPKVGPSYYRIVLETENWERVR